MPDSSGSAVGWVPADTTVAPNRPAASRRPRRRRSRSARTSASEVHTAVPVSIWARLSSASTWSPSTSFGQRQDLLRDRPQRTGLGVDQAELFLDAQGDLPGAYFLRSDAPVLQLTHRVASGTT